MWLPQTRSPAVEMEVAEGPKRTGAWSSTKGKNKCNEIQSHPNLVKTRDPGNEVITSQAREGFNCSHNCLLFTGTAG